MNSLSLSPVRAEIGVSLSTSKFVRNSHQSLIGGNERQREGGKEKGGLLRAVSFKTESCGTIWDLLCWCRPPDFVCVLRTVRSQKVQEMGIMHLSRLDTKRELE
jgi:hypothetical protein